MPPAHAARPDRDLRAARPRLHPPPVVGGPASRHVPRPVREDPSPEVAGRHGRPADAGAGVRRAGPAPHATRGRASRCKNYWGYSPLVVLRAEGLLRRARRASRSASSSRWSRRSTGPASRSSSTSSTTTPARATSTARPSASAAWTTRSTTCSTRKGGTTTTPAAATPLNCNHPVVRDLIIDSLVYLATELHVDGFRFDLASILGRGEDGQVLEDPPLIRHIAEHPLLAGTKLLAEAWDAAGLHAARQVPRLGPLGRVQRPVPRRRPPLRPQRPGAATALGQADLRQPRPLRRLLAAPLSLDQFRHLPRWLHAQRPRQLQPQAQLGQRRERPRRLASTTSATTAATRGRPTTPASTPSASGRCGTS